MDYYRRPHHFVPSIRFLVHCFWGCICMTAFRITIPNWLNKCQHCSSPECLRPVLSAWLHCIFAIKFQCKFTTIRQSINFHSKFSICDLWFHLLFFVFHSRYIAILPSIIPTVTRKFYFNKGDIVDKKPSKKAKKILEKFLKPGFETVSFYKVKNKRLLLTIKCFQKPIQFFEMFANTEKYVRQVKRQSI